MTLPIRETVNSQLLTLMTFPFRPWRLKAKAERCQYEIPGGPPPPDQIDAQWAARDLAQDKRTKMRDWVSGL